MRMFDYAGCIHFHSAYSYDARTPLDTIVEAGLKAGLRYAILTDHFRLDALTEGRQGYYRNLLLAVGEEISPRYNHYLAFDIKKPIVVWKSEMNAQSVIVAVNTQGGFGFIAHPDHAGAPLVGTRAYPWISWDVKGFAGIGIWDLVGDWCSALTSPWRTWYACWRPAHVLRGPQIQTLQRWDALCKRGHCVAIGETDNHGHTRRYFGWKKQVFPFEFAFRTVRTHVLLKESLQGDPATDRARILAAIREGHSYVSLDLWNDPTGFSFSILDAGQSAKPGDDFVRHGPALLEAKLPAPGRLRLVRDGRLIKEEHRRSQLQWDVDLPGVYRVEADQHVAGRWRPWIFSNPIWVQ
jgi:hypothetical protein